VIVITSGLDSQNISVSCDIRHSVPTATFQTLMVALIHSRLDYGNIGIPVYLMQRLQSVLNAAARLIFHLRRSDHISDALVCLHWLRVPE